MPIRLTTQQFVELMSDADPFRLAILGHAAIEADIDAAIAEAFDGDVPEELGPRKARWQIKIALVVGLRLLPSHHRPVFDRLATIRNRFAHGEIHSLTRDQTGPLIDAVRRSYADVPAVNEDDLAAHLQGMEPIRVLRVALLLARDLFDRMAAIARERRNEERALVLTNQKREAALAALRDVEGAEEPRSP